MSQYQDYQWQYRGEDQWVFGIARRGIVRFLIAEIYFDADSNSPQGGWKWMVRIPVLDKYKSPVLKKCGSGYAGSLEHAVALCEEALGVTDEH